MERIVILCDKGPSTCKSSLTNLFRTRLYKRRDQHPPCNYSHSGYYQYLTVMSQSPLFVNGVELASFVGSSGLLGVSWEAIEAARQKQASETLPVRLEIIDRPNYTVLAFVTSETAQGQRLQEGGRALVSSDTLRQDNCFHFQFLLSERNPSFFIHQGAVELFNRCLDQLSMVKAEWVDQQSGKLLKDKTLIITGLSLGGSLASLFTLLLLDTISRKSTKRPLCVTFGSPLLGDQNFQQAISDCSRWDSCFLQFVCDEDPVPRTSILPEDRGQGTIAFSSQASNAYRPFGTFLFCSQSEFACVEDPEVVLMLLVESSRTQDSNGVVLQYNLYERIVKQINLGIYHRGRMQLDTLVSGSHETGMLILLEAAGIQITQEQQQKQQRIHSFFKILREKVIENLAKKAFLKLSYKLKGVKNRMVNLEVYTKVGKKMGMGYYDSYKKLFDRRDHNATTFKKYLFEFWHQLVTDAAKKPQKEGENVRLAWLYAGTNYRRMVEPLEIAEYYRYGNKRDYENQGRPQHFKLLEEWQRKDPEKIEGVLPTEMKKKNVSNALTEDSLFWARLEEAIICCRILQNATRKTEEKTTSLQYLRYFEGYAMAEINKYALSPEVFLHQSSFMAWWNEFRDFFGHQSIYKSDLFRFMEHAKYKDYELGMYHPEDQNVSKING